MGALTGRVGIVTGGARGQGRAHALALSEAGADVAIIDIAEQVKTVEYPMATPEDLELTRQMVLAKGQRCLAIKADTRDTEAMRESVDQVVGEWGQIDVLVAQAGICTMAELGELTDEQWDDTLSCDLTGTFKSIRAVLPFMRERDFGRIIATSSMAGRQGYPNLTHYSAAKFGVIGLVKSLAVELASTGITVNAICPSNVNTTMATHEYTWPVFFPGLDREPTEQEVLEVLASANVQPHPFAEPEDLAELMLFLAKSHAARFITGSVFDVGMGKSTQMP